MVDTPGLLALDGLALEATVTHGPKAMYPHNARWCIKCRQWRPTLGGQFRPFVCCGCLAMRKPA